MPMRKSKSDQGPAGDKAGIYYVQSTMDGNKRQKSQDGSARQSPSLGR